METEEDLFEEGVHESAYEAWAKLHGKPLQNYLNDWGVKRTGKQIIVCLGCWKQYPLGERVCHVLKENGENLSHVAKTIFHRCGHCQSSWYVIPGAKGIHLGME